MSTETEIRLARYRETVKEPDALGRLIHVRRLRPSEQTKIAGMTAELTGYEELTNAKGETIRIPHRMPLIVAASVCQINEDTIPFPRSRGELDAVYDRLDSEGMEAATKGVASLNGFKPEEDELSMEDQAKNSSGTPFSA